MSYDKLFKIIKKELLVGSLPEPTDLKVVLETVRFPFLPVHLLPLHPQVLSGALVLWLGVD